MHGIWFVVVCCVISFGTATIRPWTVPRGPQTWPQHPDHPGTSNCTVKWFTQHTDHFGWAQPDKAPATFQQRYLVYDKWWTKAPNGTKGPIWFYCGNEATVTTYANFTGLMWENAQKHGALLVFAEHRYYGESQVCGPDSWKQCPRYLSSEQALADYATLVYGLKKELQAEDSPVIGFGGSYGGMLAAWFRMKYPNAVDGVIAASAPIMVFDNLAPAYHRESFWAVVTRDATPAAGATSDCASLVGQVFPLIFQKGSTASGRAELQADLKLCEPVKNTADVETVAYWVQGAYDNMAMGNYPYPTAYINGNASYMPPAWPARESCKALSSGVASGQSLLVALRSAMGVVYNLTHQEPCYSLQQTGPANQLGIWDYQWCTEQLPQEVPYFEAKGPPNDMFWPQTSWNYSRVVDHCRKEFGVTPRPGWIATHYGGWKIKAASNIVFTNGLYDPWSSGGVLDDISETLVALVIPEGAHHLDLMFSNPADPPSVKRVRETELEYIEKWTAQARAAARRV